MRTCNFELLIYIYIYITIFANSENIRITYTLTVCITEWNVQSDMSTENLSLAWTGDFDSLKKFSNEVLNLDGEWTQPGGDKKLFTFGNSSIVWRKTN